MLEKVQTDGFLALILPLFTTVSMEKHILSLKTAAREREGSGEIDQGTLVYSGIKSLKYAVFSLLLACLSQ